MDQLTFSDAEYSLKKRKTRREKFLEQMDELIPWQSLEKKIQKYYPKPGKGRRPYPLSIMLRVHCMQLFYNLSDPMMEDSLYEIESMRRFAGIQHPDPIPDETTILKFRHLLEKHQLGACIFELINQHLESQGLLLREGTIVDATIISAPTSTKNQSGQRDPEMHQTKKGNQWYFGMKMHIGVDDMNGVIHSLETSSANEHDIIHAQAVLHGKEKSLCGDSGYIGIDKREEFEDKPLDYFICERRSTVKKMLKPEQDIEKMKAQIRAKVEHPFFFIKRMFGYDKVRYRGLSKNKERLYLLSAFSNLIISKKSLLA